VRQRKRRKGRAKRARGRKRERTERPRRSSSGSASAPTAGVPVPGFAATRTTSAHSRQTRHRPASRNPNANPEISVRPMPSALRINAPVVPASVTAEASHAVERVAPMGRRARRETSAFSDVFATREPRTSVPNAARCVALTSSRLATPRSNAATQYFASLHREDGGTSFRAANSP
jgi:hypothetical protein